jgi:hypothetical protein
MDIDVLTYLGVIPLCLTLYVTHKLAGESIKNQTVNEAQLKKTRHHVKYLSVFFGLTCGILLVYPQDNIARKILAYLIGAIIWGGVLLLSIELYLSWLSKYIKELKKENKEN